MILPILTIKLNCSVVDVRSCFVMQVASQSSPPYLLYYNILYMNCSVVDVECCLHGSDFRATVTLLPKTDLLYQFRAATKLFFLRQILVGVFPVLSLRPYMYLLVHIVCKRTKTFQHRIEQDSLVCIQLLSRHMKTWAFEKEKLCLCRALIRTAPFPNANCGHPKFWAEIFVLGVTPPVWYLCWSQKRILATDTRNAR